jgi:N-acetylmuramoyl-L-alanine amidase
MIPEAKYLLEVSLCITIFYGLYFIFFRKTTFFVMNRIYLTAGLILSFAIPLLHLPVASDDLHLNAVQFLNSPSEVSGPVNTVNEVIRESNSFDFYKLIYGVYWIGLSFIITRLLFSLAVIVNLKRNSETDQSHNLAILKSKTTQPFTFFYWIFLPKHEIHESIIEHEKVHVQQHHWVDLFLAELVHTVLWFNPVMILYKRAIKLQHEYLADCWVLKSGIAIESYLQCMLQQIHVDNNVRLVHRFFSQTIKNRIIMMTKNKTSRKMSLIYFLALPAISLLLISFSFEPISVPTINYAGSDKDRQVVIVVDAGHGGTDAGSSSAQGLVEKEFTLSLASTLKKIGEEQGVKVILTRTTDQTLSLAERTNIANSVIADAFISIHADYDEENAEKSGIDCIVSEQNAKFGNSKQLAEQLIGQFQRLQGIRVNGIKKANFLVLKSNKIPSVVLELGYLSNAADYGFIKETSNQRALSEKIIAAVLSYAK